MTKKPYKIYLAGPDVFMPDAVTHGKNLSTIVSSYGHVPLFPLDNAFPKNQENLSHAIFQANVDMIHQADIVLANLNEFRGFEPDSGTVWEIGFAAGLQKIVIGYCDNHAPIVEKITGTHHQFVDKNGFMIEDFSLPLNLMLIHGLHKLVKGDLTDAMDYINDSL